VFDGQAGLHANYFRDYDPAIGRYIEGDPIGIAKDYSNPSLQVGLGMLDDYDDQNSGTLNSVYGFVLDNPNNSVDPFGLAGRGGERGATGGSSGKNTNNPYKHCKEDPADPNYIICKDHQTGKRTRKKKPADWPQTKMESCSSCQQAADVVIVGGTGYIVYRCLRMIPSLAPPLWWTIPENVLIP
jgi:hypothetical protein